MNWIFFQHSGHKVWMAPTGASQARHKGGSKRSSVFWAARCQKAGAGEGELENMDIGAEGGMGHISPMPDMSQITVFDRALLRQRRDRIVASGALANESAALLIERLLDVKRRFGAVLIIGDEAAAIKERLPNLDQAFSVTANISMQGLQGNSGNRIILDEEILPFGKQSFDLIICNLNLHWVNDLPGTLAQFRYMLKPDGFFLASMLGGQTLAELRHCLTDAEIAASGGISPRLSPVIDLYTASSLLQRAGFQLPVADSETLTFTYPDLFALMRDLRRMGEANVHTHRLRRLTRRSLFTGAEMLYRERYAGADGLLPATFEIIFLHGWG